MLIEIIGSGDKKTQELYENVRNAIVSEKIISPIKVYDEDNAPSYTYANVPALFFNKILISSGKSLSPKIIINKLKGSL